MKIKHPIRKTMGAYPSVRGREVYYLDQYPRFFILVEHNWQSYPRQPKSLLSPCVTYGIRYSARSHSGFCGLNPGGLWFSKEKTSENHGIIHMCHQSHTKLTIKIYILILLIFKINYMNNLENNTTSHYEATTFQVGKKSTWFKFCFCAIFYNFLILF